MPLKISATLLALILFAGGIVGTVMIAQVIIADHDSWDIFTAVEVDADPITVEPRDLLGERDRETITSIVKDGRTDWGLPMAVLVLGEGAADSSETAEEIAANRMASDPVESSEDAGDGLLLVVTVPEPDHTEAQVGFATGPNFYPRGGITPERLQYIADIQMATLIEDSQIGDAVIEGVTWIEWTHLFEPVPDPPSTRLESGLQELLFPYGTAGFAGLAGLVLIAAVAVALMTWRGIAAAGDATALDGVAMAAVTRGRVDEAVRAGTIIDAVDRGTIAFDAGGRLQAVPGEQSLRDRILHDAIRGVVDRDGVPTPHVVGRHLAASGVLRLAIEDRLAEDGWFHPRSPVFTVWIRGIAAAGTVLGLIGLVLSVLGEAAPALAAAIALTAISLIVLIWNERRSWATRAGRAARHDWLMRHRAPEDRERALYETIVGMETIDLLPERGSPLGPAGQRLAATLAP